MDIDAMREHDAKTGGSIYPQQLKVDGEKVITEGITVRDYFARQAMPIVARIADLDNVAPLDVAYAAYEWADAMLAARLK